MIRKALVLLSASAILAATIIAVSPAVTAFNPHPPCTSVNLTSSPPQAATTGNAVTLTATTTGCNQPAQYQFFIQPPGGVWAAQGAYSTTNTFEWNTSRVALGVWGIGVHARADGTTVPYDVYFIGNFTVWYGYCDKVTVSTPGLRPVTPGTVINLTASMPNCQNTPEFRFYAQTPGGAWQQLRGYSTDPAYSWNTTGLASGHWHVEVQVRQTGSSAGYEAYIVAAIDLGPLKCIFVNTDVQPSSPQPAATVVTLAPTVYGCSAQAEFWIEAPGGVFTIKQGYGVGSTYSWDTTGLPDGRYQISVWARQVGSSSKFDVYNTMSYYIGT